MQKMSIKPTSWEQAMGLFTILSVFIALALWVAERQGRKARVEVAKIKILPELTKRTLKSDNPSVPTSIASSLGEKSLPFLMSSAMVYYTKISEELEDRPWPLSENALSSHCKGDLEYSVSAIRKDSKKLDNEFKGIDAILESLRNVKRSSVLRIINKKISISPREERKKYLLDILERLNKGRNYMSTDIRNNLQKILLEKGTSSTNRGKALYILASSGGKKIYIPNNGSIELSCRKVPKATIIGKKDPIKEKGTLNLYGTTFRKGTILKNIRYNRVVFAYTTIKNSTIRNSYFWSTETRPRPASEPLIVTKSKIEEVEFGEYVNISQSKFYQSYLHRVYFSGTSIVNASFDNSQLVNTYFRNINGQKIRIQGASVSDVTINKESNVENSTIKPLEEGFTLSNLPEKFEKVKSMGCKGVKSNNKDYTCQ